MERVKVGIVGHSFVRRLANYALLRRSMNLDLDPERFEVTFVARGGLKVQQLYPLTHDIVNASRDIIFIDIGGNDISSADPVEVGDRVLAYENYLTIMADVRKVVISQMYFRDPSKTVVCQEFNYKVFLYNKYMHAVTKSFDNIDFWSHCGVWSGWQQYLLKDGVHFNQEGNRKYYNSVRGAVIAVANKLT